MPKLKPETIKAKIETLNAELSELQLQRQQLIDGASNPPLIGQYVATKRSGGTAFSRKSEKQAAHDYYALVDAAGSFICYVGKHEVAAYRNRIRLGKKVAKLNRATARCAKRIAEYQSKLLLAEQTKSSVTSVCSSQPKLQDNLTEDSDSDEQERKLYTTIESTSWMVSEVA